MDRTPHLKFTITVAFGEPADAATRPQPTVADQIDASVRAEIDKWIPSDQHCAVTIQVQKRWRRVLHGVRLAVAPNQP